MSRYIIDGFELVLHLTCILFDIHWLASDVMSAYLCREIHFILYLPISGLKTLELFKIFCGTYRGIFFLPI